MSIGVFGVAGVSSCLPFTEKGLNAAPLLHKVTSQGCYTALKGAVSEGGEAPCCVPEFALSSECHRSLLEIIVRQMAQFCAIHMAGFGVPYFCLEYLSMNGFNESFRSVVSYSSGSFCAHFTYRVICNYCILLQNCIHDAGQGESN